MAIPDRAAPFLRRLPIVIVALVAVAGAVTLHDQLTFEALRANRAALVAFRDAHYLPTVAAFMGAYAAMVAFSLPGALLATLTGGFLFGVFPGVLINVTAATAGATAIFLAARMGFGDSLAARMDASAGYVKRISDGIRENEVSVLLLIRLLPAVPFFVANLVPALVGVGPGLYVVTTFFGIMPGALVYTWVGAGLGTVFAEGGTPDLGIMFSPEILGPILALCAFAALPLLLRVVRGTRDI